MEKWFVRNKEIDYRKISNDLGIDQIVSKILVNRGIHTRESINKFLNTKLDDLHSPNLMKDLSKSVGLIKDKIDNNKKIRIVGDYDVDGVMSVYILYRSLLKLGAKVDYIIPNRVEDGYGLNREIIKRSKEDSIDTIITCDNGIAALQSIELARELGLTIIVTDHHEPVFKESGKEKEYILPAAQAIINPKQPDCNYPFKELCGAGIAYKLIDYLFGIYGISKEESHQLLEFVAIATICDVVDLIDENRIIVKYGLELINSTNNIGLKALIEESSIKKDLGVYHIGFIIGPTINASGRLDTAYGALDLLLSEDTDEAQRLARELRDLNEERKSFTESGVEKINHQIENSQIGSEKIIIAYEPEIHESVAGIVAGRIKDTYNKPTIVLTKGKNDVKGSARSIKEYNIFAELTKCKDLLNNFGGHSMAAGLSLDIDKVDLLREELNNITELSENDLIRKIYIDMALPIEYISYKLINNLNRLEPFGKGNSKPLFGDRGLKINKAFKLGKNKNVLKLILESRKGTTVEALIFNHIKIFEESIISKYGREGLDSIFKGINNNIRLDILYYPSINEYMGKTSIQIIIQNYRV